MRYAQDITLRIQLQDGADGYIYPPYLEITYGFATEDNYEAESKLSVSLLYHFVQRVNMSLVSIVSPVF